MDLRAFGRAVKRTRPDLAVVLLAYNPTEAARVKEMIASTRARGEDPPPVDQVFIWHGDVRILLAIVKHFEDQRNVERDTELAGVRAILLVENSVRFVSSYLPLLYTELVKQNQRLMADGVNARQRLRRMKARPKILLAETFEEGWALFERYRDTLLGILLDCGFCKDGKEDPDAGLEFLRRVKQAEPDMPVLMQSSEIANAPLARALDADFLDKESPYLLEELRSFMRRSLGFGDFVFQLPDGTEVARARDLQEMGRVLRGVPEEALRYHASRNHFSNWCMARTEFDLAARIRPVKVSQFESIADLRRYLIDAFERLRTDARRGVISDFSRSDGEEATGFARIGSGSLGGKGRGLGFLDALLARSDLPRQFPGVRIQVPAAVAIGTDVFDDFLLDNGLRALALNEEDDE
ncbi:MAG: histidine kinase, partial [Candidatus Eisenbacteria bacterium]|nr:histidine kinase [Candidatus Eisenbacteria bacterium]